MNISRNVLICHLIYFLKNRILSMPLAANGEVRSLFLEEGFRESLFVCKVGVFRGMGFYTSSHIFTTLHNFSQIFTT